MYFYSAPTSRFFNFFRVVFSTQIGTSVLFPPTDIRLSIVLFSQSRWRHMYCSFQQIFNCLLCCFIILYEDICTVPSNEYFICLLCCFLNPDEDMYICTVPSNRYSIVYCVVLSIQMKTYALFPQTDIQLSIVLFSQSRWRHMYCSFQQIFNCLLCCFLNPDEDICTVPSNRYSIVYCVVLSFYMRISVLFLPTDISFVYCVVLSIQMKTYVLFLPTDIQLSIVLFPQSRWRYMYCSFQQILNFQLHVCCFIILYEDICTIASKRYSIVYCVISSIQMKIAVLFLPTDIQLSIVLFLQSRWRHMHYSLQQIFNCLLCCFCNPDEDICTVPSNGYACVYCVVLSIQMKTYALFPPTDIQLSIVLFSQSRWRHMYCSLQKDIRLSIVLFSQSRWRHMYCSFQQIFNCLLCCFLNPDEDICTVPSNRYSIFNYMYVVLSFYMRISVLLLLKDIQLSCVVSSIQMKISVLFLPTDIQLSIVLFPPSRWRHMHCCFQQIFNCLLCCFRNPDEDICTVPSNEYACVYCVVLSIQMKTYALFPPTDIQLSIVLFSKSRWRHMYCSLQKDIRLSIVLFSQSRWRHMYCSFQHIPGIQLSIVLFSQSRLRHMHCSLQQIFNCLLCCFLNPDEDICTVPSNRYRVFNCLLCCSLNPDEDICTVPSNRYSIVYCVVLSIQMKTYVLFLPTDISIVYCVVSSIQMKIYVLFLPTDIQFSITCMLFYHSIWGYLYYCF